MSLYNQERPKIFGDVLGQDTVMNQIRNKLKADRFPQAVLENGSRGCGKTTCARIIAKALNCENLSSEGEPCCQCTSCMAIENGSSSDVIELDAATHNGVDDVRSIIENCYIASGGKKKVYIFDEVHMFSQSAWNALLKILEEPPKDVHFILATTELQKVPLTVLSRCCRFEFRKISMEKIETYLYDLCTKYQVPAEPEALALIAKASDGCMRDALTTLDNFFQNEEVETETVLDFLGMTKEDMVFDILEGAVTGNTHQAIAGIEQCENQGKSIPELLKNMTTATCLTITYLETDGLITKPCSTAYKKRVESFGEKTDLTKLHELLELCLQCYPYIQKNGQFDFLLKAGIINLVEKKSALARIEEELSQMQFNRLQRDNQVAEPFKEQAPLETDAYGMVKKDTASLYIEESALTHVENEKVETPKEPEEASGVYQGLNVTGSISVEELLNTGSTTEEKSTVKESLAPKEEMDDIFDLYFSGGQARQK